VGTGSGELRELVGTERGTVLGIAPCRPLNERAIVGTSGEAQEAIAAISAEDSSMSAGYEKKSGWSKALSVLTLDLFRGDPPFRCRIHGHDTTMPVDRKPWLLECEHCGRPVRLGEVLLYRCSRCGHEETLHHSERLRTPATS
jgi:hypothetical protein